MANKFTTGPEMEKLIHQATEIKNSGKIFSDTIDAQGNQYVDLVQEGGGVLGLALVGYTYILEKAGIRFYSLAGTSAGSINTVLMAGLVKPGEASSEKIIDILADKDFFDFVDGPRAIKKIIQRKIESKSIWLKVIWNIRKIIRLIKRQLGLNPGIHFENWLNAALREENITTYCDLVEKRSEIPALQHRCKEGFEFTAPNLAVIASEITTHTKVEFPLMADIYWRDVDAVSPAEFVRASMSIPFFFHPFEINNIPNNGTVADPKWMKYASYNGEVPETVKFVDGGMLSNFPIDTFHISGIPSRPTFGVRLSTYRKDYSLTKKFFSFCGAMISTMRQIHDYDFILRNPDYRKLICRIDADERFNWLNFGMKEERQKELFLLGAQKGLEFLQKFDWEEYKDIRKTLS